MYTVAKRISLLGAAIRLELHWGWILHCAEGDSVKAREEMRLALDEFREDCAKADAA